MRFTIMKTVHLQIWLLMIGFSYAKVYKSTEDYEYPHLSSGRLPHPKTGAPISRIVSSTQTLFSPEPITKSTISPITYPPPVCPVVPRNCDIKLNFSNMSMGRFDDTVIDNLEVISLNLSHNLIEHIPAKSFIRLPHLKTLDLSANLIPISELLQYDHLKNLHSLYLDDNNSTEGGNVLSEIRSSLPHLQRLHLRGNRINDFTVSLKVFSPRLSHLDLSRNGINSGEFLFNVPDTLTHLYLDDNDIRRIESDIGNIVELSMNHNELEKLCLFECSDYSLSLFSAKKMRNLYLSNNKISQIELGDIPPSHNIPPLFTLDLSYNELSEVPNGTVQIFRTLRHLSLSHNRLKGIPNLCQLQALETLDISSNEIEIVPRDSFCWITLRELKLNDNQIVTIHAGAFNLNSRMLDLNLSGNRLSTLPYGWVYPETIKILHLGNNNMKELRAIYFERMKNLEELHIANNPLTHFAISIFTNLTENLVVHIADERSISCNAIITSDDSDNSISDDY